MKVSLLNFTDDALNLLLRTKNTRLSYDEDPAGWSEEKKAEHLEYMLNTIKSSWEMVDFVFLIEGVTRAFTHELVRHRHGSYAQQSMRVIDARNAEVLTPDSIAEVNGEASELAVGAWHSTVGYMRAAYGAMIDEGIPVQDARGILPTNVTTSIMAKFNLRTLHEMAKIRLCTRAAKEFQEVVRAMRELVVFHLPWAAKMIQPQCVAEGTCVFPKYGQKECPVWFQELDREGVKRTASTRFWSQRYFAAPLAKDGKAI